MTVSRAHLDNVVRQLGSVLVGQPAHSTFDDLDGRPAHSTLDDDEVRPLLLQGLEEDVIPLLQRIAADAENDDDDDDCSVAGLDSLGEAIGLAAVRLNRKLLQAVQRRGWTGVDQSHLVRAMRAEAAARALANEPDDSYSLPEARSAVESAWDLAEHSFLTARGLRRHPLVPDHDPQYVAAFRDFAHCGLLYEWAMFAAGAIAGGARDDRSPGHAVARGQLPFLWSFAQAAADGMYAGVRAMVAVLNRSLEQPQDGSVGEATDPEVQALLRASEAELRTMKAEGLV